ncbi:MAG: hypothetical protein ACLU4B_13010 [Bilophila wadsworthia]
MAHSSSGMRQIFYDHAYRAYRVVGHLAITGALLYKQAVGNGFE